MKKKIILHCGAPKTGSTSFQHLMYANRKRLLEAGFWCPDVSRKKRVKDDIRILLANLWHRKAGKNAQVRHIRSVIERTFTDSRAHTLILSNESVLGKPFTPGSRRFMPRAAEQASVMAEVLKGYDVEVRFFVRDFAGFLPSWYVQQVRMGERTDFETFVGKLNLNTISWLPTVKALRQAFGPERVVIFDHGEMKNGAPELMARAFPAVFAALGEAGKTLPNKNISIGRGMVDAYRRWNKLIHRLPLSQARRNAIRQFGRRYMLLPFERFSNSERIALPADTAKALSERFKQDLARIRSLPATETDPVAP